jgi:hypothetical protein
MGRAAWSLGVVVGWVVLKVKKAATAPLLCFCLAWDESLAKR